MNTVLADSGPLYALIDRDDRHHERAHRELEGLAPARLVLTVATCTLVETHRLILHRHGLPVARRWFEQITAGAGVLVPSLNDVLEGAETAHRYTGQTVSLHDGIVAVLARRLGAFVWTFDHHFDLMQAKVWR